MDLENGMTYQLETASHPETLRRVAIDPVSRVEGHGKVTILLDDQNKVHQVRLHIVEFRGFEKFIQGRPYWEVPVMVQRLCGICPVSHHLAASKALDIIVGARKLTPAAEKLRRLMHYGQMLQSHALHFFHLSSPDLLFGFDSDVTKRNIVGVAAAHPEIAKRGVLLRKLVTADLEPGFGGRAAVLDPLLVDADVGHQHRTAEVGGSATRSGRRSWPQAVDRAQVARRQARCRTVTQRPVVGIEDEDRTPRAGHHPLKGSKNRVENRGERRRRGNEFEHVHLLLQQHRRVVRMQVVGQGG